MKKYDESDAYYDMKAELLAGEELLWVGKPNPMRRTLLNLDSLVAGIFYLVMLGAIVNLDFSNFTTGSRGFGFFLVFYGLLVLVLLGAGLSAISEPLLQYFMTTRTLYGISDHRVLIISGFPSRSTQSFSADQVQFVDTRVHANGTGDVIFRRDQHLRPRRRNTIQFGDQTYTVETGFFGIHNPHEVEAIMLETFMCSND